MTDQPDWQFDGQGRLIDVNRPIVIESYGPPEPTQWASVDDLASVAGMPAADVRPDRTHYDLRVCSEVYEQGGSHWVNLIHESLWWAWMASPIEGRPESCPRAVARRSVHVWVEVHHPAKTRKDPHA